MLKQHCVVIFMRGEPDPLVIDVEQHDSDRLRLNLVGDTFGHPPPTGFVWLTARTGRSMIINLARVQAVRYLWEGPLFRRVLDVEAGEAANEEGPDVPAKIKLVGNPEPICTRPDPEELFGLFFDLQLGEAPVVTFLDEDGELMSLVSSEVEWIEADAERLKEGADQHPE